MAEILNVCLLAGRLLLENGANTALVERTVIQLGMSLGADEVDLLVTPGGLVASVVKGSEHRTRIERVTHSGVRLSRTARLLHLAQRAAALTAPEVKAELEAIGASPHHYGPWVTALAVGLGCGAFGVNLGGSARDFAIITGVASVAQLLRHFLGLSGVGKSLSTFLIAAGASGAGMALGGSLSAAASILLLVPGAPLVSSTADMFRGDVLAGIARMTTAVMTILVASAGVWAMALATGGDALGQLTGPPSPLVAAFMGGLAAAGFAVLFDIPVRSLGWAAVVGFAALLTRSLTPHFEAANLLAGLSIGVLAEVITRRQGAPFSVLAVPGYIPLVPGAIFFAGLLHFVAGRYDQGLAALVRVWVVLVAVALGMGVVPALADTWRHRGRG